MLTSSVSPARFQVPICINPACFKWGTSLLEFVTAAAAAGFDRVEVSIQQVIALADQLGGIEMLASRFASMNVRIEQFSGLLPAGPVLPAPLLIDDDDWLSAWATVDERLSAAAMLDCHRAAIVCNPRTVSPEDARSLAVERLRMLADRAGLYGVRLAVEFIGVQSGLDSILDGVHPFVTHLAGVIDLIEEVNRPNVGLLLDTCHLYASGGTHEQIACIDRGLVEFVQISDIPAGIDPPVMRDSLRCPPGEGGLDFRALLASLAATGYAGPASIELFSPAIWNLDPDEAARTLFAAAISALGAKSEQ